MPPARPAHGRACLCRPPCAPPPPPPPLRQPELYMRVVGLALQRGCTVPCVVREREGAAVGRGAVEEGRAGSVARRQCLCV